MDPGMFVKMYGQAMKGEEGYKTGMENAGYAREDELRVRSANIIAQRNLKEEGKRFQSTQRALMGKSGATMEGSPMLALLETSEELGKERWALKKAGDDKAEQFDRQVKVYKRGAASKIKGGREAVFASFVTSLSDNVKKAAAAAAGMG